MSPDDSELLLIESKYREEQAELARSVSGANALAMAGALADDDTPATPSSSSKSSANATLSGRNAPHPTTVLPNQKLGLLRALLSTGDLNHSTFILAQFPFLVHANPDVADLILRLLKESIAPAYEMISVRRDQEKAKLLADLTSPRVKYVSSKSSSSAVNGSILPASTPTKVLPKPLVTHLSGKAFPDPNKNSVFFFADWKDRLPKAHDWDEVAQVLGLFLPLVQVQVSRNFSVFTKICRIISSDLKVSPPLLILRPRAQTHYPAQPGLTNWSTCCEMVRFHSAIPPSLHFSTRTPLCRRLRNLDRPLPFADRAKVPTVWRVERLSLSTNPSSWGPKGGSGTGC